MATWNFVLAYRPGIGPAAVGAPRGDLSLASSRKLTFSLYEPATLTFSMPGNDPQTGQIRPLDSDILAYRDEILVQRFRVVSRVLQKADGVTTAQFGAVSYKALFDAAIFHEEYVPYLSPAAQEQTLLAWNIIEKAFGTAAGGPGAAGPKWLGITGRNTTVSVVRPYPPPDTASAEQRTNFFDVGQTIRSGIDSIAAPENGFEWDIVPHPTSPLANYFLTHQKVLHGRDQWYPNASPLKLSDGGSILSWTHTVTPEYANVIRFTGNIPTDANVVGGVTATTASVWVPSTKSPVSGPGRWEKDVSDPDQSSSYNLASAANQAASRLMNNTPEVTVTLARNVWEGPNQLWVGDSADLIITEPVLGVMEPVVGPTSQDYILWIDERVRVIEMDITVDDLGAEDVELSINRPKLNSAMDQRNRDAYVQARNRR